MTPCKSFKNIAVLSLISVIALSGCGRMPKIFGNNTAAPTQPHMESVMNNEQSYHEMKSAKGVNTSNLFSQKIRSDSGRLDRLEHSVQSLRNEFDTVRPSIDRLISIEGDVQTLIGQLEAITAETTSAATPIEQTQNVIPTAQKTKKMPAKASPTSINGTPDVYNVRLGEHPGKTRLVLDVSTPTSFSTDIDNNENILIIDMKNTNWSAPSTKNFKNSTLVSSYSVESNVDTGNTMLIVQLKKNARIAYKDGLKALSGNGQRIVVDLAQ